MAKSKKGSKSKKGGRGKSAGRASAKKKGGKKSGGKKAAAKKAAAKKSAPKAGSALEALAKKILKLSQLPNFGPAEIRELYHADAVSIEGSGQSVTGYAGLEEKMKGWHQMTAGMSSKARNVWTGPDTICIEWDSTVTMRDGRTVKLVEVAVHEIKDGKIKSERYYYNPAALAPPQQRLPGV